jgi:hypothetical protein
VDHLRAVEKVEGCSRRWSFRWINVGEQTGGLDEMLTKIADFYDDEVDAAVSGLMAMMEPMIVFLGVIVGGMVVAMYLPIFRHGERRRRLIPNGWKRKGSAARRGLFVLLGYSPSLFRNKCTLPRNESALADCSTMTGN